jgi:hypothetical protein
MRRSIVRQLNSENFADNIRKIQRQKHSLNAGRKNPVSFKSFLISIKNRQVFMLLFRFRSGVIGNQ